MSSPTVIRVRDVSKKFVIRKDKSLKERVVNRRDSRTYAQEFWALRDVNLDVESGHTLGLIGGNGSGKSTLLKTIGGILTPTTGYVERRGRLAALLELGAGFNPDLTGRENVYLNSSILGISHKQTDQHFEEIVDFSGIEQFIDTPVKFYSSGMYVRLAFSVAVHVDPEILLIDEVLAVGDEPFQRKCLDKIKQFQHDGRTIIMVTHSLDLVRSMCDRVVLLDAGSVIVDGEPGDAVRHFRETNSEKDAVAQTETTHLMEITDVRTSDGLGHPSKQFETGQPLSIEFEVISPHPVDDWATGIAITDASGTLIYGTNTVIQEIELEPTRAQQTVRFTFDSMPLAEGQYFVTVATHPNHGPDYFRIDRACSFQVRSDARDAGMLALSAKIQLTS